MLSEKQKEAIRILEFDPLITDLVYGGAAGGGKSYLGCNWQIMRRLFNPGTRGLIGRNTLVNLKLTTLKTFWEVWQKYYKSNPQGVSVRYDGQLNVLRFSNGSEIDCRGLAYNSSDPDGIDYGGLELTDAFIDEANGCSFKYVNIVSSRIRFKLIEHKVRNKVIRKQPLLMTCNPGYDWIRDNYYKDKNGNRIDLKPTQGLLRATLSDNPSPEFREDYEKQLKKLDVYDQDRLLYGDWDAVQKAQNPFFYAFNELRHVKTISFNPSLPIIISIDFNWNPFCAIFCQMYGRTAYVYDEVAIENADIFMMIEYIKVMVPPNRRGLIRITGDNLGNNRNVSVREHMSNYQQLRVGLGISETQFDLPGNPGHVDSRSDCNAAILELDFAISNTCVNLRADCKLVSVDTSGQIIKRNRDKTDQRSDFLDCLRYFINTYLEPLLQKNR